MNSKRIIVETFRLKNPTPKTPGNSLGKFITQSKLIPPRLRHCRFDPEEKNVDVSLPEYECFYSEGDIRLLEKFLNEDPSSPLPPKEIKTEELKSVKSSVDKS
ncbi:hypothetical protein Tco_1123538 [Tanacetum coccineum]|uniref:Uncharacterized protein n=1 Tax=Tanacetum coccineum TaxID=301880 RepID=A0ABQ5J6E1_9ASTR